jgi:hypothetical protein
MTRRPVAVVVPRPERSLVSTVRQGCPAQGRRLWRHTRGARGCPCAPPQPGAQVALEWGVPPPGTPPLPSPRLRHAQEWPGLGGSRGPAVRPPVRHRHDGHRWRLRRGSPSDGPPQGAAPRRSPRAPHVRARRLGRHARGPRGGADTMAGQRLCHPHARLSAAWPRGGAESQPPPTRLAALPWGGMASHGPDGVALRRSLGRCPAARRQAFSAGG